MGLWEEEREKVTVGSWQFSVYISQFLSTKIPPY